MQQEIWILLCRHLYPNASPLIFIFDFSAPASASNYKAASGTKPKVALDPHIRLKDGKLELVSGRVPLPKARRPSALYRKSSIFRWVCWRLSPASEGKEGETSWLCPKGHLHIPWLILAISWCSMKFQKSFPGSCHLPWTSCHWLRLCPPNFWCCCHC